MYTDPTKGGQNPSPYPSTSGYMPGYSPYPINNNYPVSPYHYPNSTGPEQGGRVSAQTGSQQSVSGAYAQRMGYDGQGYQAQGYYNNPASVNGAVQQRQNPAYAQGGYSNSPYSAYIPQTPDSQSGFATGGYPLSNGGYPQTNVEYSQPAQGYSQPAGGYTQSNGYSRQPYPYNNAAQQVNGYPQAYPQMNGYAQSGGSVNGAQASQGYRMSQGTRGQVPLNGGGYVPEKIPVKKRPFIFDDVKLVLLSAVLLILAVAGLVSGLKLLKAAFLILSIASVALFWLKPMIDGNKRLCFSIVFGALVLVTCVSLLVAGNSNGNRAQAMPPAAVNTEVPVSTGMAGGNVVIDGRTGQIIDNTGTQVTPEPSETKADTSATDRLESFFLYWSANKLDEMLTLCSPTWQSSVESAKTSLFGLMANRTPTDYSVEKITGTDEDMSRTVTVVSSMDRNNGKPVSKYRLTVIMIREGDEWYVDPNSLKTYESAETTEPVSTTTPTAQPEANANTVLYYNPEGGTKYHLDQNCVSTHAKYLPMKGHFTYDQVNDSKYASLSPCNVCAAPLR